MQPNKVERIGALILKADEYLPDSIMISGQSLEDVKEIVQLSDELLFGNHGATWMDIFTEWQRSSTYSHTIDGLAGFLETKFMAPIRK
jgi:trehalose-6-phosphatase